MNFNLVKYYPPECPRVVLYLKPFKTPYTVQSMSYGDCSMIVINRGKLSEMWTWCKNIDQLAKLIEYLVDNGHSLEALSTLKGEMFSVEELSLTRNILERLSRNREILRNEILVEHIFKDRNGLINVIENFVSNGITRSFTIYPRKCRAKIKLEKKILSTVTYDNLLRVLSPKKIPA